jgi:putative flippase GtrA
MNGRWRMLAGRDAAVTTRARLSRFAPHLRRVGRVDDIANATRSLLVRWVPKRFHAITDELAKFGTIGLINLGVNFGVFNLLLWIPLMRGSEVKAKAVATIVATTCAYFLNRHWTYRHRPKTTLRREYSLFFFFNAVGLVIETAFVALAKYGFNETNIIVLNLCSFFGIAVGTVFRFWAYRTHVFKAHVETTDEPDAVATVVAPVSPAVTPANPPRRVVLPQTIAISHRPPAAVKRDDDEDLHQELVQLELADLVDDEVDKATRR